MNILDSIILGIIEGITEFLPISSTGHLILGSKILGIPETEFLKSFEIGIQLGAILAVVILYYKLILNKKSVALKIMIAFIPTAILGLIFYEIIKTFLLGNVDVVIWSLFIGGIIIIIFELFHKEKEGAINDLNNLTYKQSFLIGIFQTFAFIPGVSRAAATIIGGMKLGITRKTITEFSFLLAIPTMAAASGLDIIKNSYSFSFYGWALLFIGFITAFIVSIFSIKFLLKYIQKHNFMIFGIYRIGLALIFWLIIKNQ